MAPPNTTLLSTGGSNVSPHLFAYEGWAPLRARMLTPTSTPGRLELRYRHVNASVRQ